jgi:hypothetical protein
VMKASPALARRLAATEEELARLKAAQQARAPVVARIAPRIAERFERIVIDLESRLQRDTRALEGGANRGDRPADSAETG